MAVKIRDRQTPEGRRFEKSLRELSSLEVRIGFQSGSASEKDGTDICDVAAWNELGTENIPSRPFLRKSVDENEGPINDFLQGVKKDILSGKSGEQVLKELGIFQKDLFKGTALLQA